MCIFGSSKFIVYFKNIFMKKILISLIITIFTLNGFSQETKINLENLWLKYKYFPETLQASKSMKDGEHYTILERSGHLDMYDYKNGERVETIIDPAKLKNLNDGKELNYSDYSFNQDESKVLLISEKESIYRHSFKAAYYIYDLKNNKLEKLEKSTKQQLAEFSPDGTKISFFRDNNLFVKDLTSGNINQITFDGEVNKIINGAPDWVYEEEFSFSKAYEWSHDSKRIAYIKFNESDVKMWEMKKYGDLYPEIYKYKYPKAGEDNSIVSVHIYNLNNENTINVDIGEEKDIYIPRIMWASTSGKLAVQKLNRLQNHFEIILADENGKTKVVYDEVNKYYIDINDNLTFLNDNNSFIITSESDGYNHVYKHSISGDESIQLTKGEWDVIEVLGVDEKSNSLYFISAENSPLNRDLYNLNLKNNIKTKLSEKTGTNSVKFSNGYKYYINTFSDINTPPIYTAHKSNGKELYTIKDNSKLKKALKDDNFVNSEFFEIETDDNIKLNAWMIKPPNFDESKKYPVLMYVYGGPGSQTAQNTWGWFNVMWFQMLAQNGYIVVSVDNRGTGARGEEFKKCTYQQLGNLETIDQINSAKHLGSLPYVDSKRIGIFGWSYGGYMSTLCMTKGANYFKAGIAVAPVTNWRYYDNIYTERFMRTPQENADGYDNNSPITHVNKLKGSYLLVHGTSDDNVHVQNSMDLINALVNANKQFDMHFYVNHNHSIAGGYARYHLYKKMTDFLIENL
jgi:dipeptidyl-peptidase-4